MSIIPDYRNEHLVDYRTGESKEELNPYYEGNLNAINKETVWGYDFAAEVTENFFFNLDVFEILGDYINIDNISTDFLMLPYEEAEQKVDEQNEDTQFVYHLRNSIFLWMETHRDEMIVSLIENQPDDTPSTEDKENVEQDNN